MPVEGESPLSTAQQPKRVSVQNLVSWFHYVRSVRNMTNILVQCGILATEMLPSKVIEMREKPKRNAYRFSVLPYQHAPLTPQRLCFKLTFTIYIDIEIL